jgi:hypothetical protein
MRSLSTYVSYDKDLPDQITWNALSDHENHKKGGHIINLTEVFRAHHLFLQSDIVEETALTLSPSLSQEYEANIYVKREDHQRGSSPLIQDAHLKYEEPTSSTSTPTKTDAGRVS